MSVDLPLWWEDGALVLLDQTSLPHETRRRRCARWEDVRDAIATLAVRGAPAIGLAAAFGLVLAARSASGLPPADRRRAVRAAAAALRSTRPTAVNLAWALDRLAALVDASADADLA